MTVPTTSNAPKPNWRAVKPHVPLVPGDPLYVERPAQLDEARKVVTFLRAGDGAHLLMGTAGVGKSTELARIKALMGEGAVLIKLGGALNVNNMSEVDVVVDVACAVAQLAAPSVRSAVEAAARQARQQVLQKTTTTSHFETSELSVEGRLRNARHTAAAALVAAGRGCKDAHGGCFVLLDGLERARPEVAQAALDGLEPGLDDLSIVAVAPLALLWGGGVRDVWNGRAKPHPIRPIWNPAGNPDFFSKLLTVRLGCPVDPVNDLVALAAEACGGVPRTFLQLMLDARTYGSALGREDWPAQEDLALAIADQRETLRHLLKPGDDQKLMANHNTDGRELIPDDRTRFLAHGFLLETDDAGAPRLRIHPLLKALVVGK